MTESVSKENILGTERIGRLLIKFGMPGIISLVVNSIYNVVDQIFIGQGVGYLGNAATNITYPFTMFVLACGMLIGDGAATNMSLYLGMGKKNEASRAAAFGSVAALLLGAVLAVVLVALMEPLCWAFGATEANIGYCLDYGTIISAAIPAGMVCCSYMSILRADGKPKIGMIGLLLGCGINIVLDPIFIFICGWGVKGAALATILGEIANAILYLIALFRKQQFIELNKEAFLSCLSMAKNVLRLGVASFILQLAIVIAIIIQNKVLATVGAASEYGADIPLAALGVTMKVFTIVIAVVNGLSSGAQPIYGYNYGSGNLDRVKAAFLRVFIFAEIVLIAAFAVFQLAPMAIVNIFGSQDELYNEFVVRCLKIFLFGLPLTGLQTVSCTFFQSLGRPVQAAILSLSRQIIFMIPILFIFVNIFGIDGCLYMGPVADVCALILTLIIFKLYWKKIFR